MTPSPMDGVQSYPSVTFPRAMMPHVPPRATIEKLAPVFAANVATSLDVVSP